MTALQVTTAALELARSGEGQKSTSLGLAVILVLCVASYFLFKSMSKHLKKVRDEFPVDPAPAARPAQPAAQALTQPPADAQALTPQPAAPPSPGGDESTSTTA